jgi:hypothetical protein
LIVLAVVFTFLPAPRQKQEKKDDWIHIYEYRSY